MAWPFIVGRQYNRRVDLHDRYGGQQRGGISTPRGVPAIFVFTGASGLKHGYADSWQPDGTFHYCGEGQVGDMTLIKGNKAIATHAALSKDILLFKALGHGRPVEFIGSFSCAAWFFEEMADSAGDSRQAIIFKLIPADVGAAIDEALADVPQDSDSFKKLREAAYAASRMPKGVLPPQAVTSYFARSKAVRDYALARANGDCENCGKKAPFLTKHSRPFLEVHHIHRLSDGGPDSPSSVAAICPNCHREAHHGGLSDSLNARLGELIRAVEKRTTADYGWTT